MWVLSLLNQPVQETEQRDSVIKIGEKEIPFNANKEEEAKISLIEYSSEESNTLSENQDRLEFKVKLNTVPIEFKAEIYDIDIENGTKFYRKSIEGEEAPQNTITIKEGDREYIVSEECNAGGGISPKGDELTIRIEGCKVKDKETEEEKDFSMELKLKAKAEEQDNNEVGIAESPKSKFFTTRGGCGGGQNIFQKHPWLICYFGLVWEDHRRTNQIRQEVYGTPPNHNIICYRKVDVYNLCNGVYLYSYEEMYLCNPSSISLPPINF